MALERQELHCHACDRYVQFTVDTALNGRHVLHCPNCDHEHCRVVINGRITDERWASRNGGLSGLPTFVVASTSTTSTALSTFDTCSTGGRSVFLYQSWLNTTAS